METSCQSCLSYWGLERADKNMWFYIVSENMICFIEEQHLIDCSVSLSDMDVGILLFKVSVFIV